MLHNYFIVAWRNIRKNKAFSLINVFGLSVGLAFTLLIGAYVWGELQVNGQLKNADNQYILQSNWKDPNMGYGQLTVAQLPKALKQAYPNLVANCYHWDGVSSTISKGDKHFKESVQIGDSTLLTMYGFKLLYGDRARAFAGPFAVVISAEKAVKYFGKTDAVGQTLSIENFSGQRHDFVVTAVLDDPGRNTVTTMNDPKGNGFFISDAASNFMGRNIDGWNNPYIVGFLELKPGVKPSDLDKPMHTLLLKNAPAQTSANLTPYLVSLKAYYRQPNTRWLYTLSLVSFFILLMAVINFVNMCIARSASRMKEMGIRKVLGGMRRQLIWQFLTESTLVVMIATVVGLIFYVLARPFFSEALGVSIVSLFAFPAYFYLVPVGLALVVGLLSGLYPALVLSALRSVDSLKGKSGAVKESVFTRKTLVALQFGIAIIVLICAVVISQQVNLFFGSSLGYDKDYIVYAPVPRDWSKKGVDNMEAIRYQLEHTAWVKQISLSYDIPNGANSGNSVVYKPGADSTKALAAHILVSDNEFADTYHIPVKAGTFFTPVLRPGDESKVVINEAQAKALGWRDVQKAIGQPIRIQGYPIPLTVCGVIADYHFESMQSKIPLITVVNVNYAQIYRYFSVKLKAGNMQQSIASLQKNWNRLMPGAPFEYSFMDEALKKLYATELQLKQAAYIATVLSVIIVLLGVLGLISLSIQKRSKEISIRRVLGATVRGIMALFMRDFLATVMIAGIVACPIAYLVMTQWLNDYAYKVNISLLPFIGTVAVLTLLTSLLIGLQTIKAASANPAKSLRMN